MSLARVHNFTISLDGFGTGEGLSHEAPFGHAGERLHQWMFATRFWGEIVGQPGGSGGVDDAFAQRSHACDIHPRGCLNRLGGVGLHANANRGEALTTTGSASALRETIAACSSALISEIEWLRGASRFPTGSGRDQRSRSEASTAAGR